MKTFKMFIDYDKEEAWLNRKAREGWMLDGVGVSYSFTAIEPGPAVVRVDYQPTMTPADFDDYRNLFWDAGWQHIAGSRRSGNQYFASHTADPDADIFSDSASKAQRYRRAAAVNATLLLPFFVITVILLSQGNLFTELYLTPGLWQMEGWEFARAFAFETPFALMRAFVPVALIGACAILGATAAYQWTLYRRAIARVSA